jgi:uncharacterized protein YcbK (DUF882 family)
LQAKPLVRHSGGTVLALIASLLLGSCTSTVTDIDTASQTVQPQFSEPAQTAATEAQGSAPAEETTTQPKPATAQTAAAAAAVPDAKAAEIAAALVVPGADTQTQLSAAATQTSPDATLPAPAKPGDPAASQTAPQQVAAVAPETVASPQPLVVVNQPIVPAAPEQPEAAAAAPSPAGKSKETAAADAGKAVAETAAPSLTAAEPAAPAPAKKQRKTLFAAMFGDTKQKETPAAETTAVLAEPKTTELALAAAPAIRPNVAKAAATEFETPQLKLTQASLSEALADEQPSAPSVDNGDLPGVRKGALFEIKRRDSLDSDADIDIGETDGGPVLLASAGGFARLAPNGLKVQRQSVDVACLKPQLVRMLKKIEAHYRQPVVVTSGYRSPTYNRRVRGAKNSLHMYCAAADIQVAGVGKWELARYLRSMPGRGGVGTYCHTNSLHVDIGPDRDWNWRCSRRK